MSRREHVVRTDDQGGIGDPRSLGGCTVLCSVSACGEVYAGRQVADLSVSASTDYQRCYVAATIGAIDAWVPDPPPVETYTLTFETPLGAEEGAWSPWLEVPMATEFVSLAWEAIPAGTRVDIYEEGSDIAIYQFFSPPVIGTTEWVGATSATRLRLRVQEGHWDPGSNMTITLEGDGADQATPIDEQWVGPPTHFAYTLETTQHLFEAYEADEGRIIMSLSTNRRAELATPSSAGQVTQVEIVSGAASNWRGSATIRVGWGGGGGVDVPAAVVPDATGTIWTHTFPEPLTANEFYFTADIRETQDSLNSEGTQDAVLAVKWYIDRATEPCPDDWPGRPGFEVPFEDHPL